MNLLSNAVKFTPAGGQVEVQIREEKRTNGFCLSASDGVGYGNRYVLENIMNRLFQPFEQESSEMARNNVEAAWGFPLCIIWCSSWEEALRYRAEGGRECLYRPSACRRNQ